MTNSISEVQSADEFRDGLAPIWAAAKLASPQFECSGRATFPVGPSFEIAASSWRENIFLPLLQPMLLAALQHARRGEVREMLALDRQLSAKLPKSALEGSCREGRRLAQLSSDIRGDRGLQRIVKALDEKSADGHLATIFAARAAAFSLSDRVAIGAYLFQELSGGAPHSPVSAVCDLIASCLEPLASEELRAA